MKKEKEINLDLYSDEEVQQAIKELFSHEKFVVGMKAFLPEALNEHILSVKNDVKSIQDFQANITSPFLEAIQKISITELSASGLEKISKEEKYLFISNHRNIVLDSAYLNLLLFKNGISTSQIAIGDNLMKTRVSELLFRINKSFVVKRTGTPRELYAHAIDLSKYICRVITEKVDSVWIAQREGRAKDGNDKTQMALLKMISMSGRKNIKQHFQKLKIVPVSISYEMDPTALLKTKEFLQKKNNPNFKKSFQEDLNSMLLGIQGQKGKVHFNFGKPLKEELDILDTATNGKEELAFLATIIDESIYKNYRLHPVNYVAYDLLFLGKKYQEKYTANDFSKYSKYFESLIQDFDKEDQKEAEKYLLAMYANPVINTHDS